MPTHVLLIDSWAGRSRHPVEIISETPKRYKVKLLTEVLLPSKRSGSPGDVVLVPKFSVKEQK